MGLSGSRRRQKRIKSGNVTDTPSDNLSLKFWHGVESTYRLNSKCYSSLCSLRIV